MKIDRRYYCFGCGEKGDAIDFVAKFYGIGKKDAEEQIATDFGISFDDCMGRKTSPKHKRKLSLEQRFERVEKKCFRVLFCEDFLAGHPMKCIHGRFFDINGAIGDAEQIKAEIYHKIAPYVTSNIAKKATTLKEHVMIAKMDGYVKYLIDKSIYRFTIDKNEEILPTIRGADGFVKQVRLEDMALNPNLTQPLNNLSTHAVMAQILDETEYVEMLSGRYIWILYHSGLL